MKTKKNFLKKLSAGILGFVMTLGVGAAGYAGAAGEVKAATASKTFTLTSSDSSFVATGNETYFSQPYGYKKANGTLTFNNNTSDDFYKTMTNSSNTITSVKIGFKGLRNGNTASKITMYLIDSSGNTKATGSAKELVNQSNANNTAFVYETFTSSFTNVTGFKMQVTTFGKNVLINGASYEITYTQNSGSVNSVSASLTTSLTGSTKGSAYAVCSASVSGTGEYSDKVNWSLTSSSTYSATSTATTASIDSNGKIVFSDNGTVYAWATSSQDSTKHSDGVMISATNLQDPPGYSKSTGVSDLINGRKVLITGLNNGTTYVLGSNRGNNRNAVSVTLSNNKIVPTSECSELTLGVVKDGSNTFYTFHDGDGYLAASSSGSNYITVITELTNEAKFSLTYNSGLYTMTTQGTYTRNTMRCNYGNNPPIFSLYASTATTGVGVSLYVQDQAKVSSIALSGDYQTEFFTSDSFNHTNLVATATLADGTTLDVTNKVIFTSPTMTTAGTKTITVSYAANNTPSTTSGSAVTATYSITVTAVQLDHITISGPTKTTYNKGDNFESTGLVVTAFYNNNTNHAVTPTSITGYDMSTAGQQTVTVTYTEGLISDSKTFTITVNDVVLSSIALSGTYPTSFYTGDTFSHSGLVVTATYSDASTVDVSTAAEFSGYNMTTAGNQVVTVSYGGKTAQYGITVTQLTLASIALSGSYKTAYFVGDTFSSSGLVVTASYNKQGYSRTVTPTSITGYDMSTAGSQTVTVSYTENSVTKSATYSITVTAVVSTGLVLHTDNVQKTFEVGATFNHDGLIVDVTKNNGTTVYNVSGYQVSTPNMEQLGEQTVTVTYDGKSETYIINISAEKLAYNLTFASTSGNDGTAEYDASSVSDMFISGSSSVNTVSLAKVYPGKDGFGAKFSSSKASGSITINMSNKVKPTKIVIEVAQWISTTDKVDSATLTVKFNSDSAIDISPTTTSLTEIEIPSTSIPNSQIESIYFESIGRSYVKSIKVYSSKTEVQLVAGQSSVEIYQNEEYTPTITDGTSEVSGWTLSTDSSALIISGSTITGSSIVTNAQVKVSKAADDNYVYKPCYISVTVIELPAVTYTLTLVNGSSRLQFSKAEGQVTTLEELVKPGFTFKGWNDGTTDYKESYTMPSHDVTLTANFEPIDYSVTYDSNGSEDTAPVDSNKYNVGNSFTPLSGSSLTKQYMEFDKWNTESDGSGDDYRAGITYDYPVGNLTLYAIYKNIQYSVTYDRGDAESGTAPQKVTVNAGENTTVKDISDSIVPPFGTEFAGWEYNGELYHKNDLVLVEEDIEFVAKYKALPKELPGGSEGTFISAEQGFENTSVVSGPYNIGDFGTVTFSKNDGTNPPTYYTSGSSVRVYGGNEVVIKSKSNANILGITFTFNSAGGSKSISCDIGTLSGNVWSPDQSNPTDEVSFVLDTGSGNRYFEKINIITDADSDLIKVDNLEGVGEGRITLDDGTTVDNLGKYGLITDQLPVEFIASTGRVITYADIYLLYDSGVEIEYSNDYGQTWDYNPLENKSIKRTSRGVDDNNPDLKDTNAIRYSLTDTQKDLVRGFKVMTSFGTNSNMTVDYNWEKNGSQYTIDVTKAYVRFAIDVDEDFNKYFTEKDQYGGDYWIGFAYSTTGGNVIVDDHLAESGVDFAQYTKGEMPANNEFGLKLNCLSNLKQDKTVALIVKDSKGNLVEFSKQKTASFEDVFYAYFTDDVVAGLNAEELAVYNRLLAMLNA